MKTIKGISMGISTLVLFMFGIAEYTGELVLKVGENKTLFFIGLVGLAFVNLGVRIYFDYFIKDKANEQEKKE